jgi:serine protease
MLVPGVTAGISILGLITAGSTTAAITQGAGTHHVPVHVINLHRAYEARLAHSTQNTQEQPAGMFYTQQDQLHSHGRGGNDCAEPNCPLVYNGGSVQHNPRVYLLLWGPDWSSDPNQAATAKYLENFYRGLGAQPNDNWSTTTSQYGDGTGHPTFHDGVLASIWQDTSTPPFDLNQSQLAAEADTFTSIEGVTDLNDAQVVIATQSGTCPEGFYAPSCGGTGNYCAWHSSSNEPYTNLPYVLDAGSACGEDFVSSSGTYDGFTMAAAHEYADTITDPFMGSGWWDSLDHNGGEIADKCAWSSWSRDVALSTGSFAMQPLWSNSADGCVMPIGGQSDIVTVASPGNQSTYQGSRLSLTVDGTSTGNHALTWTATGLPSGLTLGSANGVITGQVQAAPNTYNVTVSASDSTGAFGWASFKWKIKADVGTAITNQSASKCLNDFRSSIAPGASVVLWTCQKGAAERWSHPTNTGELIVLGQCLTDPGRGGAKTLQVIEPCTGAANQEWYHNGKSEYVVEKTQLCLTDPNGSTLNGQPAVVQNCTNAKDQRWSGS